MTYRFFCVLCTMIFVCATAYAQTPQQGKDAAKTQKTSSPKRLYRINPGDVLSVHVWNEKELSVPEVLVRPDGHISMPILGEVTAGNKTIQQVQKAISSGLSNYLRDEPLVTVSTAALNGNSIFVLGKVNRPGQYTIRSATDVTQALALAGGVSTFAKENAIKILRRNKDGVQRAVRFRYESIKEGKRLTENIILKSGDVVIVP